MINENLQQVDPKPKEKPEESSEPITTPEEVPESNDEKIDQDFPGYPHYPAKDDILNPDNGSQRVEVDIENFTPQDGVRDINLTQNITPANSAMESSIFSDSDEADEILIVPGTEADVTEDDLLILGEIDGQLERNSEYEDAAVPLDLTGEDLDVPGAELDDANESLGEEDEENNYYSIGGDNHENLDEDRNGL